MNRRDCCFRVFPGLLHRARFQQAPTGKETDRPAESAEKRQAVEIRVGRAV
jgi:hypothetical protein